MKLESKEDVLRHFLSSLAFRFQHATDGAPAGFASFEAGQDVRTPAQLVLHMSGMMQFVLSQLKSEAQEKLEPLGWQEEKERFIDLLTALDRAISEGKQFGELELWQFWQGQLSDTMTHIGQLATLRRLAGSAVSQGVRYWQADMPRLSD